MTQEEWTLRNQKTTKLLDKYLNYENKNVETVDFLDAENFLTEKQAIAFTKRSKHLLLRLFKLFNLQVVSYQGILYYNKKDLEHLNSLKKPKGMKAIGLGNIHKAVIDRLHRANIDFETEKRFEHLKLPFDIYIPGKNLAIEIQGPQHFFLSTNWCDSFEKAVEGLKKQLERDNQKIEYCKQNNIDCIWITEDSDVNDLFLYLQNALPENNTKWLHRCHLDFSVWEKDYDYWLFYSYDKEEFLKKFENV